MEANETSSNPNKMSNNFKRSPFTIRIKLMVIISSILFVSLSLIIGLATYFFKNDSEIRVKENDLQVINLVSLKIQSEFLSLSKNMKLLAGSISSRSSCEEETGVTKLFFDNEEDVLYVGIYKKTGTILEEVNSCLNPKIINKDFEDANSYIEVSKKFYNTFNKSFDGAAILKNVSPSFNAPILGFSFPYIEKGDSKLILISYLRLSKVPETFRSNGINLVYMVDEDGNLLAHAESKLVQSVENYATVPVVKSMINSKIGNGQFSYTQDGSRFLGTFKKLDFTQGGIISIIPEEKAFEAVYAIRTRNIFLMIAVLNLAILIVFIYSRSLTIPILELVVSSGEVEIGNYQVYNQPKSGDEIGILTNSFNSMTKGLEEREKIKSAFGKFVNEDIAELSMKGEIKLGGERKFCAIFFSDIRSFTSISEKLEPEEVVEFLNQYMTEMVRCVKNTGGLVDKYIGDAIMATWGALRPIANETEAAINASLQMREALLKFNVGRGGDKKPVIKIGCGINSGYVISGQIGSNERLDYTVIGDSVNLASRIESLNKPFGTDILISSDSYEKVKEIFIVEKMPSIKVKGKDEPQIIYAVLGRKDDSNCFSSLNELRKKLNIVLEDKGDEKEDSASKKKTKKKSTFEEKEVKYEIL